MNYTRVFFILSSLMLGFITPSCGQKQITADPSAHILSAGQLEKLFEKPPCLEGYITMQSGPLLRFGPDSIEIRDSTFRVEKIKISSDGFLINGWLYLPPGDGKHPLIVLTNGGGGDPRSIKSLSDWIAPVLAHCGVAAFVHDKRGTGESEGVYRNTTYEDYITDAGNCAIFLSKHKNIDPGRIGVFGGSEGGRIAVIAAKRYDVFSFAISYAGTVVSSIEDRINAQKGWLLSQNLADTAFSEIMALHEKSIRAWASENPAEHAAVNLEIDMARSRYSRPLLPWKKEEMETIPAFDEVLPTWNSLSADYMSEMEHFSKRWLAIFGETDQVVPTKASVENILKYMPMSGNKDYFIAILHDVGHAPVSSKTNRMVRLDNLIINWMKEQRILI
jgi:pimeloyl-ACP methyl ester carboxylesterase